MDKAKLFRINKHRSSPKFLFIFSYWHWDRYVMFWRRKKSMTLTYKQVPAARYFITPSDKNKNFIVNFSSAKNKLFNCYEINTKDEGKVDEVLLKIWGGLAQERSKMGKVVRLSWLQEKRRKETETAVFCLFLLSHLSWIFFFLKVKLKYCRHKKMGDIQSVNPNTH